MTTEQFLEKQRIAFAKIAKGEPLAIAVLDTHRQMANRIFINGKDANGTDIGKYNSSKGIYVNPKNSPKKFPTGGQTFGSKRKYKTKYFPSYKDFKAEIGQQNDKVRLTLFGRLQSDFVTALRKDNNLQFSVSLKESINSKKVEGLEKRFGKKIFALTKKEREGLAKLVQKETNRILNA